jgi:transposase
VRVRQSSALVVCGDASDLKTAREFELHRAMNSLPMELRRRIVEAYERKEGTYFELAQRFGVGEATVYRLLKLKRERGNVSPGAPSGITAEELPDFVRLVAEFPNATLEQLKQAWVSRTQRELSRSSIVRALRRAGITRKKEPGRRGGAARPSRPGGHAPPEPPKGPRCVG